LLQFLAAPWKNVWLNARSQPSERSEMDVTPMMMETKPVTVLDLGQPASRYHQ